MTDEFARTRSAGGLPRNQDGQLARRVSLSASMHRRDSSAASVKSHEPKATSLRRKLSLAVTFRGNRPSTKPEPDKADTAHGASKGEQCFVELNTNVLQIKQANSSERKHQSARFDDYVSVVSLDGAKITVNRGDLSLAIQPNSHGSRGHEILFLRHETALELWEQQLRAVSERKYETWYASGAQIGEGAYAKIYLAVHKETKERVAVKVIQRRDFREPKLHDCLERELALLRFVHHPAVLGCLDIFDADGVVRVVMRLCSGGDLRKFFVTDGNDLPENALKHIMRQIVQGAAYLHSMGVIHRDIKLQNILFVDQVTLGEHEQSISIKLVDFGLTATTYDSQTQEMVGHKSVYGSPFYLAPEIVRQEGYSTGVDVWAIGMCCFAMLLKEFPFETSTPRQTYKMIAEADLRYTRYPKFFTLSEQLQQFIQSALDPSAQSRPSAEQLLQHPWLSAI